MIVVIYLRARSAQAKYKQTSNHAIFTGTQSYNFQLPLCPSSLKNLRSFLTEKFS